MKKVLVTILAFTYLIASVGTIVNLHYCMDKLVASELGNKKSSNKDCPYCGMAKTRQDKHCSQQSEGCCKDEQKYVKIEKDQKTVDAGFDPGKPLIHLAAHFPLTTFSVTYLFSASVAYPVTHAPPRTGNTPLFVRNCVFRI